MTNKKNTKTTFYNKLRPEIKTKLLISGNIFKYYSDKIFGKEICQKFSDPFTCPRCALEGIKSDLKQYPNHFLVCGNCQFVCKQVGGVIYHALF